MSLDQLADAGWLDAASIGRHRRLDLSRTPMTLEESIERMLVWTVIGDRVLTALRRFAQKAIAVMGQ